jgi:hypothetical protein
MVLGTITCGSPLAVRIAVAMVVGVTMVSVLLEKLGMMVKVEVLA